MTTKHVGNNRLLALADFLETLPIKRLSMETWWQPIDSGGFSMDNILQGVALGALKERAEKPGFLLRAVTPRVAKQCGFAACAVGWAATYKPFRRTGLKMVIEPSGSFMGGGMEARYKGRIDADAVTHFFGLQQDSGLLYSSHTDEWEYLFGPHSYDGRSDPTPARVAKRIRKFVKRRQAGEPGLPKRLHINRVNATPNRHTEI